MHSLATHYLAIEPTWVWALSLSEPHFSHLLKGNSFWKACFPAQMMAHGWCLVATYCYCHSHFLEQFLGPLREKCS